MDVVHIYIVERDNKYIMDRSTIYDTYTYVHNYIYKCSIRTYVHIYLYVYVHIYVYTYTYKTINTYRPTFNIIYIIN